MTNTTLYTHTFRERKALLDAALTMIREGRFQHAAMSEVAYKANLSESTATHFFATRNQLADEIEEYTIRSITNVVTEALKEMNALENVWICLYKYYIANPAVLMFIDTGNLHPKTSGTGISIHTTVQASFVSLFEGGDRSLTPQTRAALFHAHVISTAKTTLELNLKITRPDLKAFAKGLVRTLR